MRETCFNCLYSVMFGANYACRRYPPAVSPNSFIPISNFYPKTDRESSDCFTYPTVQASEWCGEWKPRSTNEIGKHDE